MNFKCYVSSHCSTVFCVQLIWETKLKPFTRLSCIVLLSAIHRGHEICQAGLVSRRRHGRRIHTPYQGSNACASRRHIEPRLASLRGLAPVIELTAGRSPKPHGQRIIWRVRISNAAFPYQSIDFSPQTLSKVSKPLLGHVLLSSKGSYFLQTEIQG